MSNTINRITYAIDLIESELESIRNLLNIYNYEDRSTRYNRYNRQTDDLYNIIRRFRNLQRSSYQYESQPSNHSNRYSQPQQPEPQPQQQPQQPEPQTSHPPPPQTNTSTQNRQSIFDNILPNTNRTYQNIPDLVEVSFIDTSGRPITSPRNILESLFDTTNTTNTTNTNLQKLRLYTTVSIYNETNTEEEIMCTICRNNINQNEVIRKINNCNHFFHISCIDQWCEDHNQCPICRTPISETNQ